MSVFVEVESLVVAQIEVIKTAVAILKLETRLASLSVYPLLLALCLLLVGLMGMWAATMLALGYMLAWIVPNTLLCILAMLMINSLIVVAVLRYMLFNLKNMSFEKTRQYIANKENAYVQSKKTANSRHHRDATNIAVPTKTSDGA